MHTLARVLSTGLNPLIAALWVGAWVLRRHAGSVTRWVPASVIGLAVCVALAELGKAHRIWPDHPLFPSGHETFCASVASSLVAADRRWLAPALTLTAGLAWALVAARYHNPTDVAGGFLLGSAGTALVHAAALRRAGTPSATPPSTPHN